MKLNINPTRMELLKLKRRLKTAERGYKLLKDKRDGLMKEFMTIVRKVKECRARVEATLGQGFKSFVFASADMQPKMMNEALAVPSKKITLEATTKNVMSVNIPQFTYNEEGDPICYSLLSTPSDLDTSLGIFSEALADMVKLAEIEHSARLLAGEIEKTRRRVNALEYVFIPNIKETIKYIESKLAEQERGVLITLMKVKEKIME
ncbi:V-type ATP synthase subunit D [Patescibacteria group bacterium]|nr:V-type ATP synthase subunit D [Patescibacteria group bacterium]MBU4512020.1 V-type ATP synthase subunit D [Patescibacteria group bacterium]